MFEWLRIYRVVLCVTVSPLASLAEGVFSYTVHEVRTISPEGSYSAWPTVVRRSDGSLFAVWSGGRESHACPFGRLESMMSRDEGTTWSWPRVLLDTAIDDRDGGVLETTRGTLIVTTFSSIAYARASVAARAESRWTPDQREKWHRFKHAGSPREIGGDVSRWILRSEDGGLTWAAPQSVSFNSPHGPIQLADGRLLYPAVEGIPDEQKKEFGFQQPGVERNVGIWESIDDGVSWRKLSRLPTRGRENPDFYHEPHGVETTEGVLVVQLRSHAGPDGRRSVQGGEILQSVSRNGGRTWSELRSLGIHGYPSHLLRLRDGRLLMSYADRRNPFEVQVRVSEDGGDSWSVPLVLSGGSHSKDMGYPSTVELGRNGEFLTVWYEVMPASPKAVLRQAKWFLGERKNPEDKSAK